MRRNVIGAYSYYVRLDVLRLSIMFLCQDDLEVGFAVACVLREFSVVVECE